jgi:protein SCO1/2
MASARRIRRRTTILLASAILTASSPIARGYDDAQSAAALRVLLGVAAHPHLPVIKPAPDFILADTANRDFALSMLRGRVVLLSFIYTGCTTTCPLLMQRMTVLADELRQAGLWGPSASFVSVTVDPDRDTTAVLSAYAEGYEAIDPNWRFLHGEPARLRPVLVSYDEWTRPLPDGEIDHPARVYLIDRNGNIREIYALGFFDEHQALIDMRALLETR